MPGKQVSGKTVLLWILLAAITAVIVTFPTLFGIDLYFLGVALLVVTFVTYEKYIAPGLRGGR